MKMALKKYTVEETNKIGKVADRVATYRLRINRHFTR